MKLWHKIFIFISSVILVAISIYWWMSYEPMKITIINETREDVNVTLLLLTMERNEIYNESFFIENNGSQVLKNVTNFAGSYYIKVIVWNETGNMEKERKIKYGKYYETIEVILKGKEIEIRNKR